MLIEIRDRASSLVAYVIIGLLIISFALWGIQEYFGAGGAPAAATVNGVEISVPDYSNQLQQYRQRLQSVLGESYAQRYPEETVIKKQVIEDMVNTEILRQEVTDAGFRISDAGLARIIRQIPQFQRDGAFDPELYTRLLLTQRYDKARFEGELREQEKMEQFENSLTSSSFMTQADLQRFRKLLEQSRDFSYARVSVPPDSVSVSPEQIDEYYQENKQWLRTPEQLRLAYIELKEEALVSHAEVTAQDARILYDEQPERYMTHELRRTRQILIRVDNPETAVDEDWDRAMGKAEGLVQKLRDGASFDGLAQEHSQDTLSAEKGGDIGLIARGDLASTELEKVLFSLDTGAYSQPVRTEQGVHLVQVIEIQAAGQKPFASVRQQIIDELRSQMAQEQFAEIADELANLVVELPDDLTEAAEVSGLEVQETGWLTPDSDAGIFAYPDIRSLAFTADILEGGLNSELIEVANGHMIAFRVLQHRESKPRPLDEVSREIREFMRLRKAAEQASAKGEELLAQLQGGMRLEELSDRHSLERVHYGALHREDDRVPARIMNRAFTLAYPDAGHASVAGVPLGDGSYALLELHAVLDGPDEVDDVRASELSQRVHYGGREFSALVGAVREQSDVEVFEDNL